MHALFTNQPNFFHIDCFSNCHAFWNSITIYYFAKEEADRRVVPLFPETYVPIKIPFRKGLHQEFRQPSGTGIDLRFFGVDDLSIPSSRDDVFPIIISADTCLTPYIVDDRSYLLAHTLPQMQINQVVLAKNHEGQFVPKVIRQLLWTDDTCYELREIYGLGKSGPGFNDNASGKDCVVCMTEPKDIALLPCRHMVSLILKFLSIFSWCMILVLSVMLSSNVSCVIHIFFHLEIEQILSFGKFVKI